jgi:ubiquinone/menaquinone biosynthesis C-methylase UbiE
MTIIKATDRVEEYRARALASDVNELSGRTGRADLTDFVASNIAARLAMKPGEVLVDIGCGDGSVLRKASQGCEQGSFIGILPTSQEVERVQQHLRSNQITVRLGLADATGLPDGVADKTICNGVLLIVPDVERALHEIARISKKGALIYIGEIPKINEQAGKTYGDSIIKWLYYVLRTQGLVAFGSRLRQVLRGIFSKEPFIISPKEHFFAEPVAFTALAERHSLQLIEQFPHREITPAGIVFESPTRIDYLFRRAIELNENRNAVDLREF